MSSLLLGDPTKSYLKLLLWREAASWVERISAGDVVYFKCEVNLPPSFMSKDSVGYNEMQLFVSRAGRKRLLATQLCTLKY